MTATSSILRGKLTWNTLQGQLRRTDIGFALGLISILVIMIMPMPRVLMDLSLALSITFSVLILMTVLFIEKPLEFSAFPTVLLVSTMLRLGLNVASTRLILSHGHEGPMAAGNVIEAFGRFVMGGNYVIGIIVFSILVLVNFVVITKGSGRIAEVAARFSLDSLPGKQMAIDADLSAGVINEAEAKQRRKELMEESNFYGSMDGAAKFVRGDAVAGICITFINIIAGIIIGVAQMNLDIGRAAQTYTILTIGDGLVSQIPALIVSTAAGMLVSKAGNEGSADKALFQQLNAYPTALGLSSMLMVVMSCLPGVPFLPFIGLAGITGFMAWSHMNKESPIQEEAGSMQHATEEGDDIEGQATSMDVVRLEIGYGLLSLLNQDDGKPLPDQIRVLRKQLAQEYGFVFPQVRIQDNLSLNSNEYVIKVKEVEFARGQVKPDMLLVMDAQARSIDMQGEAVKEPAFGLDAMWISPQQRGEAEHKHYTIVEAGTVITTHLTELIKENMSELLTFSQVQEAIDTLDNAHQKLIKDVVPGQLSYAGLQRILQNLLAEYISIRDMPTIVEAIAEGVASTKDAIQLTEHVRMRLARQICAKHVDQEGVLPIISLSQEWEKIFNDSFVQENDAGQFILPPSQVRLFAEAVEDTYNALAQQGITAVLMVNPAIRFYVHTIIERVRPTLAILSQNELHSRVKFRDYGQVPYNQEQKEA